LVPQQQLPPPDFPAPSQRSQDSELHQQQRRASASLPQTQPFQLLVSLLSQGSAPQRSQGSEQRHSQGLEQQRSQGLAQQHSQGSQLVSQVQQAQVFQWVEQCQGLCLACQVHLGPSCLLV
jgi:hypothetical protein